MAKRGSNLALYRPAMPILRIAVPRAPSGAITKRKTRTHRRGKAKAHLDLTTAAMAGAGLYLIDKMTLPAVPLIGKKGVVAIGGYFLSKQGGQVGTVARVITLVTIAEIVRDLLTSGSISGEDGDLETV